MKTAAFLTAFVLCSSVAVAAERARDLMSEYDMAGEACRTGGAEAPQTSRKACQDRDRLFYALRDRGYALARDPENPNGYVWR